MTDAPLVIDVGMYDGSDTAYYLFCGYRVVAIEANPRMFSRAQSRFQDYISAGYLTLLNVAIAATAGLTTIYINSRDEGSSTINQQNLEDRGDEVLNKVEVPCIPFSSILQKYDTPFYLKIDIEGSDHLCLEAIDPVSPPSYVSWEAGEDTISCLNLMNNKGYTRFKLINQTSFYDMPSIHSIKFRVKRKLRELFGLSSPLYAPRRDWTFARGHSAGPCCEATSGRWHTFNETVSIWETFCKEKSAQAAWYDVHAALPNKMAK